MNWGNKLILVFIAFGIFIGTLVYKCMQTPVSLVSAEYYKDELNYQQVIDGNKSAGKLSSIAVTQDENAVALQLPVEMKDQSPEGRVWFYCVNNSNNDRKFKLEANEQQFALNTFKKGRYVVKVEWKAQGTNYYAEKEITIQ